KITLEDKYLKKHLKKLLNDISKSLREKVKTDYQNRVIDASQFRSLTSFQSSTRLEKDHMYLLGWCGGLDCATKIENETRYSLLGYDFNQKRTETRCLVCGATGNIAVLAKRY
ncbi:MAG: hypothetical protein ACTSSH_05925, partial [Candidatus Heimdallarchaeota archaeon]